MVWSDNRNKAIKAIDRYYMNGELTLDNAFGGPHRIATFEAWANEQKPEFGTAVSELMEYANGTTEVSSEDALKEMIEAAGKLGDDAFAYSGNDELKGITSPDDASQELSEELNKNDRWAKNAAEAMLQAYVNDWLPTFGEACHSVMEAERQKSEDESFNAQFNKDSKYTGLAAGGRRNPYTLDPNEEEVD